MKSFYRLALIVFIAGSALFAGVPAHAASTQVSIADADTEGFGFARAMSNTVWPVWTGMFWSVYISFVNGSVNYGATVYDNASSAYIPPGSTVSVGQTLRFVFTPHQFTDINWVGSGAAMDTPYGQWTPGAGPTGSMCDPNDYIVSGFDSGPNAAIDAYVSLDVNPPAESISNTSNLSCGAASVDGGGNTTQVCTVIAPGALNLRLISVVRTVLIIFNITNSVGITIQYMTGVVATQYSQDGDRPMTQPLKAAIILEPVSAAALMAYRASLFRRLASHIL